MCRALGVNRTSFDDWQRRAPSDRELTDAWLTEKITQIHADSDGTYGARRIHAELRLEHGIGVGRKRVERLMKAAGVSGLLPRKRRRTTVRLPDDQQYPFVLQRYLMARYPPQRPQVWNAGRNGEAVTDPETFARFSSVLAAGQFQAVLLL